MVTDDAPASDARPAGQALDARDLRIATQTAQVAEYWRRCALDKLTRSLSDTQMASEEDEDDDDDDLEYEDIEYESDLEYRYVHYRRRAARDISGLPLLCGNCGVSFFSLRSVDDDDDCYCSGECKWSVIMYREMDRRMCSLRANRERAAAYESAYSQESDANREFADGVISCH